MILQSQIEEVINAQQISFKSRDTGIERQLLASLPNFENHVLIISGIRRCGKSTLLRQLYDTNYQSALYLNFEDVRLAGFEVNDFTRLGKIIENKGFRTLFFDEIQIIDNWELFIRQKLDEKYQIIINGSNASLLSRELGTKLTGRHISIELFPFSFYEFKVFHKIDDNNKGFEKYLETGGFPEFIKQPESQLLNQLLTDILQRDIAVRYNVRDLTKLRQLAVYLISNIGKPFSGNKLTQAFNFKSNSTTLEYISYMEQAYLVQLVPMFSYSLKAQSRNPKKVYAIDIGLFSQNSITFTEEKGRRLENIVFLNLRRRYRQIYYFKEKGECDFIVMKNGKPEEIIQVCWELNDLNQEREINGLKEAMTFFNVNQGILITYDQSDTLIYDNKKIDLIPIYNYLDRK
jgi:predicted AAA+ superfamily ATPase